MPLAPARACSRPGCPNLQPCGDHPRGETYRETVTARPWRALYKQQRWVRLSARVRAQEPVCEACRAAGRTPQPTRHVDHVTPHRGDLRLFYDRTQPAGVVRVLPLGEDTTGAGRGDQTLAGWRLRTAPAPDAKHVKIKEFQSFQAIQSKEPH